MINVALYYSRDGSSADIDADRILDKDVPQVHLGGSDYDQEDFIGCITQPDHLESNILEDLWFVQYSDETTVGQIVEKLIIAAFELGLKYNKEAKAPA